MQVRIESQNLRDRIYEIIRDMILHRELEPGEKIIEEEMAERIGVSRTPLREALLRLETDGIVKFIPRRGAFVRRQNKQKIIEVLEVREVLEGLVARLAAQKMDSQNLSRLRACLERINETQDTDDQLIRFTHADEEFHSILLDACGSGMLQNMMSTVNTNLKFIRLRTAVIPGRARRTVAEHYPIMEAIAKKDDRQAERLMRVHIASVTKYALKNIEKMT